MAGVKDSYQGGFEQIYALEKVDAKKIRRLHTPEPQQVEFRPVSLEKFRVEPPAQMLFPFAERRQRRMRSLRLEEPIQLLSLPMELEDGLLAKGRRCLKDLLGAPSNSLPPEARRELAAYLGQRPAQPLGVIDFASFLRCLLGDLPRSQARASLAPFGLERLLPTSAQQWLGQREGDAQTAVLAHRQERTLELLSRITDAFVIPWMHEHGSIASDAEIGAVLRLHALDAGLVEPILQLLGKAVFCGEDPWRFLFPRSDKGFLATDSATNKAAQQVLAVAGTYFYRFGIHYPAGELVAFVERECAKKLLAYPKGFVARALRLSSRFRVRRRGCGGLTVGLEPRLHDFCFKDRIR